VSLTVTDNTGTTSSETSSITIRVNKPPILIITYYNMTKVGQIVEFSAISSYDTDGEIIEYAWDFGDGTTSYLAEKKHIYLEDGEKIIKLVITDNELGKNETTINVMVSENVPPVILVNNSRTGFVFEELSFVSESYDIDGEIVSNIWAFGDGETSEGSEVYHTYISSGNYIGWLSVTDDNDETSIENIVINIVEQSNETIYPFYTILTTVIISLAYYFKKPWLKFIENL
jgi:PKD repeat protein